MFIMKSRNFHLSNTQQLVVILKTNQSAENSLLLQKRRIEIDCQFSSERPWLKDFNGEIFWFLKMTQKELIRWNYLDVISIQFMH